MTYLTQLDILLPDCEEQDALHFWTGAEGEERGEVFTKPEVAEFILDLTGWRVGQNLRQKRLLEPSCGTGDFVIPAIRRLLEDSPTARASELGDCICAVEVNQSALEILTQRIRAEIEPRFSPSETEILLEAWLHHADFLTLPFATPFTHIAGNPPYLRIEALPKPLMLRYRALFRTMYDRADLYIAFFEKGLSLLEPEGRLGYICANRWMKNRYGGPLREMIAERYHMEVCLDFTDVDAFHGEVTAYPAVTVIRNGCGEDTIFVEKEGICVDSLPRLTEQIHNRDESPHITYISGYMEAKAPWLLSKNSTVGIIRNLEEQFPLLEDVGCKVGIGVATGADRIYIGSNEALDVEDSRKVPLLTRKDLRDNHIHWQGKYVLNPFEDEQTGLVNLDEYPRFQRYLEVHRSEIVKRHVARKNPDNWFKTIDRIYPALTQTPKLVIPDIQGEAQIAFDPGNYYPHHNLYFITSKGWNLLALQKLLLSRVTRAFVAAYSVKMRGDCLRYQAQNLRKIRIPQWEAVPEHIQQGLIDVRMEASEPLIQELYQLDDKDWERLNS